MQGDKGIESSLVGVVTMCSYAESLAVWGRRMSFRALSNDVWANWWAVGENGLEEHEPWAREALCFQIFVIRDGRSNLLTI